MKGVNLKQIKGLAKKIISLKESKIYPFNKENYFPDAILPNSIKSGSKEHSLFLLHAISMDSMSRAIGIYKNMRKISDSLNGDLSALEKISKQELNKKMEIEKEGIFDSASVLIENAKRIKHYENDPRKLKQNNLEDTIKEIRKFKQYGEGKAALLIKNFVRFGIWDFPECQIPIKIDRHTVRISLGYGVINTQMYEKTLEPKNITSKSLMETINNLIKRGLIDDKKFQKGEIKIILQKDLLKPLTEAYLHITKTEKISAIDLDDALWAIGTKLCIKNDYLNCEKNCPLKCLANYPSDNQANWFFLEVDKRKNKDKYLIPFENFYVRDILK